jgi:hypothetical protein
VPAEIFEDDGGTRAWRSNQATWGREPKVIDVTPGARWPWQHFAAWFRRTPTPQLCLLALFLGAGLPFLIVVGGLLLLALSDAGLINLRVLAGWVVVAVAWRAWRAFRYR